MTISLDLIKKVREATGAGINDVKKALDEANGKEEKAVEILRKQGQKVAAKRAERSTNEGLIGLVKSGNKIGVLELACETDFVARNEDFINAVEEYTHKLLELGKDEFAKWVQDKIQNDLIIKIGENIQLGQYDIIEGENVGSYLHSNKKIASVVVLAGGSEELAKEVAMHVAAMNPKYLKPEDIPAEEVEKEKEIYREQLKQEGPSTGSGQSKPEEIIEKILDGKLQKFYTEVCLLKQPYIKDDKMSVEKLLDGAEVTQFARFSL